MEHLTGAALKFLEGWYMKQDGVLPVDLQMELNTRGIT